MAANKPTPELAAQIKAAEEKYGDLPKGVLEEIASLESKGGRDLVNPKSSARGPFQFMEATGPEFGLLTEADRMDVAKSTDAAARLLIRNKQDLERRIGRQVTPGELYLAHQQGAAGAAKLLKNPDKLAAEIVGDPERIRLNGADPATTTAGAFATKWTSKIDKPVAGATPTKKPDPRAASLLGAPPTADDFYTFNPARLEQLKQSNRERMAATPLAKEAIKPVNRLQGSLLAQTPEADATAEVTKPAVPADRRSTAILQGLSVYEKSMHRLAPALMDIQAVEAPITAPEGVAGTFSRGVDSGLANAAADREYFGAIIDTLTGQPDKAASRIRDARLRETEAEHHTAGMQNFQEFLDAPSIDGFFSQAVRSMGEVAPSSIETVVTALATGGTVAFAKLGLSQGAKIVAKTLIKDLVTKKAKGEALDTSEEKLLDVMFKDFKRGAVAGAFGQEYVPAAGGAFAEFGEAGKEMGSNEALMALGIGIPQAAIGVYGEKIILKGLLEQALKKSTRQAGDSVLKRFAADVSAAILKSGAAEGVTEVAQESISVAQRAAIDPDFTGQDALLRIAQSAFSGFFGGGALGGAGGIPAAGIGAVRRSTTADSILKRTQQILRDASNAKVETEVNAETKGLDDDAVMSGKTAPESLKSLAAQVELMKQPNSPKPSVWASEQQDIGLQGMIPGEVSVVSEEGSPDVYVANLPGHGNLMTTDAAIANELMATFNSGGDVKTAIGLALGYTGKPGENVVRATDKAGNVVHEQTFDEESRGAAIAKAAQVAEAAGGVVDTPSLDTALEERKAISDKEAADIENAKLIAEAKAEKKDIASYFKEIVDTIAKEPEPSDLDQAMSRIDTEAKTKTEAAPTGEKSTAVAKVNTAVVEAKPKPEISEHSRVSGPGRILGDESYYKQKGVKAPNGRYADALYEPAANQRVVYGRDGESYKVGGMIYRKDGSVAAYFTDNRGKTGDYEISDDSYYSFSKPIATKLSRNRDPSTLTDEELQAAYDEGVKEERTGGRNTQDREVAHRELNKRGVQPRSSIITETDAEEKYVEFSGPDGKIMMDALKEANLSKINENLVKQDIFKFLREGEAQLAKLEELFVLIDLNARWPTTFNEDNDTSLDIAIKFAEMRARLSPQSVLRSGDTVDSAVAKLKVVAGKYNKKEKAFLWEFMRRLAALNGGVMPGLENSDLLELNRVLNPTALATYHTGTNRVSIYDVDPKTGKPLPPIFVIAHELSHWAYGNVLTAAQKLEFLQIIKTFHRRRRMYISPKGGRILGNEADNPQEFFANQFASWAATEFGLTPSDVLDTEADVYNGRTFSQQAKKFFSGIAEQILGYVKHVFDPSSVAPDLRALFTRVLPPLPPKTEALTVKKMVVDDDGETSVEDEADTASDTTAFEDQLNSQWAELDAANAVRIEQYNEREEKRTPEAEQEYQTKIDEALEALAQFAPEDQFAEYIKYEKRMPLEMIQKLAKLHEENDRLGEQAYFDVAEDKPAGGRSHIVLSITQRDAFPNSETVVTRDIVRNFLTAVKGWSSSARFNGSAHWVKGPNGPVIKAMGGSYFWLVNRRTGKAMRLNGTPPAKGKTGFGQQGLGVMARAGTQINVQTDQGLGGDGLTVAQKHAQGLMTMMKALAEAGWDLHYGATEKITQPFVSARKLPNGPASEVAIITKSGRVYTLPQLFNVKAPFETSKSDFDAGEIRQQLTEGEVSTKSQIVNTDSGKRIVEAPAQVTRDKGLPIRQEPDGNEQRALKEAKQKNQGGLKEEAAESAKENTKARKKIERVLEQSEARDFPALVEVKLDDIPDDVDIKITNNKGMWQAVITSPRFDPETVESNNLDNVVARAHAKANSQPQSRANRYSRILLEDAVHNTQQARENINEEGKANPKIPEIAGVPAAKDQTSLKDGATKVSGLLSEALKTADNKSVFILNTTNQLTVLGKLGPMTERLLGLAMSKFTFERPVEVMTLSHLKENFDKLTAVGGPYASPKARDILATAIADMENENEPGRVIMGIKNLIILRNTPRLGLNSKGERALAPDDAAIAAVLAHEIGHIIFKLEYERNIKQGPDKSILWNAFVAQRASMATGEHGTPTQYQTTKAQVEAELKTRKANKDKRATFTEVDDDLKMGAFEEWFADQVMAWTYKESGHSAKNATDSIFKRIADKFRDFFTRVNEQLKGRLQINWTFNSYMKEVVRRHAVNRKLNNDVPVATEMLIKKMSLATRLGSTANYFRSRAVNGTTMKKIIHATQNLVQASVDFMGVNEHGPGGKALRKFFGTESQSQDSMGWNKRRLFTEARFANEFAKIFGFNEKTHGKEWRSQRVTDILNEAEDNDIDTVNLSTPEAKAVRALFERLYDDYLIDPTTNRTWFGNIRKMVNYGGPRMFNADKINQDPEAFVQWLQSHPSWGPDPIITNALGKPISRAHSVVAKIIGKIGEPIGIIEAEIELEVAQGILSATMTPSERAAEIFARSTDDRAVMEAKNKILRDAEKGNQGFTMRELLDDVLAVSARNSSNLTQAFAALNGVRTATDPKVIKTALDKFWMDTTKETRLTPGMDPALTRTLPNIKTSELRNADPNDANGWLLPQAVAVQQYFHFVTRKVEYSKMGGFAYVNQQLESVPEEYRKGVDEAIMANLGKFGENMSNKWRLFNSAAAVATVFTTLLFTTLSSITDFAGIATRSKDFRNLGTYFSVLKKTLTDREYVELARSVGTVVGRAQDHAMIGLGELDHANRTSRAIMNGFFRYTGLEFFTRFSRTVATGMGKEFILNTANRADFGVREARYLSELGLTREDVQNWVANGQDLNTSDGMLVRDAIARFADESIIRPDASQRPTWASNPYFSVVWQLKSYYYGFGKTVMGGLIRETKNRYDETGGDIGKAAAIPALLAVTIIPLTMLGLGSREWAKYLFQLAIPGVDETVFRTSYMDGGEYSWEIFKRTGVLGPFSLALTTLEAFQFEGIAAPFTANIPIADMFDDSVFDGDGGRLLPVINNIK